MTTSHTPGPWKASKPEASNGWWEVNGEGGRSVCTSYLDAEANARLIAAAPDLLEACKAILETCNSLNKVNPADLDSFRIDTSLLTAAIAKAS